MGLGGNEMTTMDRREVLKNELLTLDSEEIFVIRSYAKKEKKSTRN